MQKITEASRIVSLANTGGWEFWISKSDALAANVIALIFPDAQESSTHDAEQWTPGGRPLLSLTLWHGEGNLRQRAKAAIIRVQSAFALWLIICNNWFIATLMPAGFENKPPQDTESFAS